MKLEEKKELVEQLTQALTECVERIRSEFPTKSVYAFVLYPSSGFRDFGIAFSTREDLPEEADAEGGMYLDPELAKLLAGHEDLMQKASLEKSPPPRLVASEWKFASYYPECFDALNESISLSYDELYDQGVTSDQINSFFTEVGIESLKAVKSHGLFSGRPYEEDVYFGIQFPDSPTGSIAIVASEALNSKKWHEELLSYT